MASGSFVPSTTLLRTLSQTMNLSAPPSWRRCPSSAVRPPHIVLRQLSSTARRHAAKPTIPTEPERRTPEWKHQRYRDGELIPKPLSRPLGLTHPPQPGQNTGLDGRSWREKRDDLASYEKHLERRKRLVGDVFERNYYRDVGNLGKVHKGKSILAPSTPFRANLALYFPNLTGFTLKGSAGLWQGRDFDTTPALRGKVSIVSVINTEWANEQAGSFTSAKENAALHALLAEYEPARALVQFATVNVEENPLKAWMIRLFWRRLRRITPSEQWGTYFLNRRGLTDDIRDALGMWNSKVGYVFLLDPSCKIRWAGNGGARDDEKKSLVACVRRLVDEARGVQKMKVRREDANPTGELPTAPQQQAHAAATVAS